MLERMWIGKFQHEKLTKQQITLIDKCYMLKLKYLNKTNIQAIHCWCMRC
jgi:hypothetical protein